MPAGVPVIVDNTVPTPYLSRPFEHGADVVVHSVTKYIGGHGTIIGGALVDSGRFDWAANAERFPSLTQPDPLLPRHGLHRGRGRAGLHRASQSGARSATSVPAISPHTAFLALQGLETLPLRMDRICDNALAVAEHLRRHPQVEWVRYAGLTDSPEQPLLQKYAGGRAAGILSFGIKGGRDAGARFIDALKLVTRLVNIGDAKSLATHPATTTHRQLSAEELSATGVSEDLVRLSVGIEHIDDIVEDLDQALAVA